MILYNQSHERLTKHPEFRPARCSVYRGTGSRVDAITSGMGFDQPTGTQSPTLVPDRKRKNTFTNKYLLLILTVEVYTIWATGKNARIVQLIDF